MGVKINEIYCSWSNCCISWWQLLIEQKASGGVEGQLGPFHEDFSKWGLLRVFTLFLKITVMRA